MTHYSRLSRVVLDVPDDRHDDELAFWRDAIGPPIEHIERFPAFHGADLGGDMGLLVQRLGDGPARVHVDIHTTDRAAEVARLEKLGAVVLDDSQLWTVLRDPAGLVFCVVPDRSLDATNATEWPD